MNHIKPGHLMPVDTMWKSLNLQFLHIPAGKFLMGSETGFEDEKPIHEVEITKEFQLCKYQITQQQWKIVKENNPSYFIGEYLPVECVSWFDAQEFIQELNSQSLDYYYRLPTEAEWEYAGRAGGNKCTMNNLDENAWYGNNSGKKRINALKIWKMGQWDYGEYLLDNKCTTHSVGKKRPNNWGLCDMVGNIFEWCEDWYGKYSVEPVKDPVGSYFGSERVVRGASWVSPINECSLTNRFKYNPLSRYYNIGFRLVRVIR